MPSSLLLPPQEERLLPRALLRAPDQEVKEALMEALEERPARGEPPAFHPRKSTLGIFSAQPSAEDLLRSLRQEVEGLYFLDALQEESVREGLFAMPASVSLPYALRGLYELPLLSAFAPRSPVDEETLRRLYPSLFLWSSLTSPRERKGQHHLLKSLFLRLHQDAIEREVTAYAPSVREVLLRTDSFQRASPAEVVRTRCLFPILTHLKTPLLREILLRQGPALLEHPREEVALPLLLSLDLEVLLAALAPVPSSGKARTLYAYALLERVALLPPEGAAPFLRALLRGEVTSLQEAFAYASREEDLRGMPSSWWVPLLGGM